MGLIRNAVRQGMEVGQYIGAHKRRGDGAQVLDAIVVGSGPAGLSATLSLKEEGLSVKLLEAESFGGTIAHYPRGKVVMTGPLEFPGMAKIKKRTMSKEQLLEIWQNIQSTKDLSLETGQEVIGLERASGCWQVITKDQKFSAANVVLALGRRGSPRKLGVAGEDHGKVSYRLLEPDPFADQHVLVVGGGNSAAECAIALAEFQKCASVGLSYRRGEFARLRAQVRQSLQDHISSGAITSHLMTQLTAIDSDSVTLHHGDGRSEQLRNDAVVVQIGGTPPSALLGKLGIATVEKRADA
jgi:thioredoxin reductase